VKQYKCVLCPIEHTEHDFVEPPKVSTSKKKTEKEKERERLEREQAVKAAEYYRKRQEEMNRPVNPREPLKRTTDNNWVHVTCAVWTPEVKFGSAKALSPSEGIPSIPRRQYDEICVACNQTGGACVGCHHCKAPGKFDGATLESSADIGLSSCRMCSPEGLPARFRHHSRQRLSARSV
jgi:PHD-zinc-finger like domain